MKEVVVDPRGAEAAVRDFGVSAVLSTDSASATDRISVYAEAYFSRIVEALASDFRALRRVLGEESFSKIVADYLKMYPSRTTNIGEVGSSLPQFLSGYAPESPYLSDLAALEWAAIESFYSREADAVAAVLDRDPSELRFSLHPSVRFVDTSWNIENIWRGREDEFENVPAHTLLVFRTPSGAAAVEALDAIAPQVLLHFSKGLSLGAVCERLPPEFDPARLSEWFARWSGVVLIPS